MKPKLLLYCTKAKPYLLHMPKDNEEFKKGIEFSLTDGKEFAQACIDVNNYKLNGKIVAECDFEVHKFKTLNRTIEDYEKFNRNDMLYIFERSNLSYTELIDYLGKNSDGYAICIKNLHIFDKLRELSGYYNLTQNDKPLLAKTMQKVGIWEIYDPPVNGPELEHFVGKFFIPVHSEELCRILNKEQTVLVRKRVLKEMLE